MLAEPRAVPSQKLNQYSYLSIWSKMVAGPMEKYNLKGWMSEGPFKQFVVMGEKDQQFPGHMIANVLAQEVVVKDQKPDELWYRIGGQNHKFGKEEFALITGLRFGKINKMYMELETKPLEEGNICLELWPNKGGSIKCEDIEKRLEERPRVKTIQAKRLLLVVMMQRLFFGLRKDATVPRFLWNMVQDLAKFKKFPWGTLIYCKTIKNLKNAITRKIIDETKAPLIKCFGWAFAVSFQINAFIYLCLHNSHFNSDFNGVEAGMVVV